MMRAIAVAVGLAILAAPALAEHAVLTPFLDLGAVSPAKPPLPQILRISASPGQPIEALLTLQLEETAAHRPAEEPELRVRSRGGEWLPLVESIPVRLLVTDGASSEESHAIYIQGSPTWAATPGQRRGKVAIIANGIPLGETSVSWTVEPALRLTADPHPFESPEVDPTRPGHYEYAPRQYRVKANVRWALEATIDAELMRDGAAQPLAGELLFVRALDGSSQPLRIEGPPVVVASGDPTGEEDAAAEVLLSVRTRGVEPGGEYGGAIELSLVPGPPVH